jgi:hypothetical protein
VLIIFMDAFHLFGETLTFSWLEVAPQILFLLLYILPVHMTDGYPPSLAVKKMRSLKRRLQWRVV